MKIAIIDDANQDIGLKILFPEADYFIDFIQYPQYRKYSHSKYNIQPIYNYKTTNFHKINNTNYDVLFIIFSLHNIYPFFNSIGQQI